MDYCEPFARQLPSVREGYVIVGGDAATQRLLFEALALELSAGATSTYVYRESKRRQAAEVERARQRKMREGRWGRITEGEQEGFTVAEVSALWPGTTSPMAEAHRARVRRSVGHGLRLAVAA
jgi:hypothetical protein